VSTLVRIFTVPLSASDDGGDLIMFRGDALVSYGWGDRTIDRSCRRGGNSPQGGVGSSALPTHRERFTMFKKHSPQAARFKSLSRFEHLTDQQIQEICDKSTYVHLPQAWSLMAEKTPADKAYIILSGTCSVRQHGNEIAQLGPGDVMGEVAIVSHTLRTASVLSVSELEVLHFTSDALTRLAEDIPAFGAALRATTAARLDHDHL
jgi:CRP/FNR family cyclic AMP-dependent transcriptional regulator